MIKTFAFASLTVALLFGAMPAHAGLSLNGGSYNALTANALTTNALTTNGRSIQGLSQQGATKDATPGFRVVAIELPAAR